MRQWYRNQSEEQKKARAAGQRARYAKMDPARKEFRKIQMRARRIGITPEELAAIEERQDFSCAICQKRREPYYMHIDHCRKSGKVRSLLCRDCNLVLGNAHDSIEILERLIVYLKEHQ
jgi:hypothetical protein